MAADPLAKACELAFEVARQGVETDPPVDPPASMRSFLYVAQLPPRAVSVAQRVIDSDGAFRARVAAQATESSVGQPGYLWLSRPEGWQSTYSSLTGSTAPTGGSTGVASPAVPPPPPAPESVRPAPAAAADRPAAPLPSVTSVPTASAVAPASADSSSVEASSSSDEIETELSSLRNLVDQLAEERESVGSASVAMTAPTESPRTETPAVAPPASSPSPSSSSLTRQLDALTADLRRARTERDDALTEKETSIARQLILEDELNTLRTETAGIQGSLQESQQTIGELQSQVTGLTAERDQAADSSAERDELTNRITVAELARVDLEAELAEVSAKWQDAQVEINSANEQRAAIEVEMTNLRTSRTTHDAERDALLTNVSTQLGEVRAERDLLAGKLETAQTHLSATRAAVESASVGINSELELTEIAVGEATVRAVALDSAIRNSSQGVDDLQASVLDSASDGSASDGSASAGLASVEELPSIDESPTVDEIPAVTSPAIDEVGSPAVEPLPSKAEDVSVFGSPNPILAPTTDDAVDDSVDGSSDSLSDEPNTIPVPHAAALVSDGAQPAAPEMPTRPSAEPGAARQQIPPMAGDPVTVARHAVSTPDVVVLIHGDPVALLGWPTLDVAARRDALVSYLGDLAADTGAAPDVVFDGRVGDESQLPTSRVVRVRLTNVDVDAESAVAPLVDSYPKQWPVAVVTDSEDLAKQARQLGASVVENGHMLDLFISS